MTSNNSGVRYRKISIINFNKGKNVDIKKYRIVVSMIQEALYEKMVSNMVECKSCGAYIRGLIAVAMPLSYMLDKVFEIHATLGVIPMLREKNNFLSL